MRIEHWLCTLPLRVRSLFSRRGGERDREDEIPEHIERQTQQNIADGMTPGDARAAARRAFGNREAVRATARETWGWVWLEQLVLDFRYAIRKLRLAPGFPAVATLSLAIGIGATVTMYAVVDAADIRELPYPRSNGLFVLEQTVTNRPNPNAPDVVNTSPAATATTAMWLSSSHAFSTMSRVVRSELRWVHDDETENLDVPQVGPAFFGM